MQSLNIITHKEETKNEPKVGIFWLVPAEIVCKEAVLLYATQTIASSARADIFYDSTFEHYTLWNVVQKIFPALKNVPYEKYPRGRVTLVAKNYPNDGTFKLMADIKILQKKNCVAEIKRVFNLTYKQNVEILRDAHYRT